MKSLINNKILIGPSSFAAVDYTPMSRLTESGCSVIVNPYKRKLTKDELITLLSEGVTGLIAGLEPLDCDVLGRSSLKVISRCGSGMSNVDTVAAGKLGIMVFSTPFGPTNAVAELTIACLLALLREIPQITNSMHMRKWDKRTGSELRGKTVAVIGYGRIGRRVGELLSAFDAEVVAIDPEYDGSCSNVKKMELHEALPKADIFTIHCSGNEHLLGEEEFKVIKQGAFVLNAARGELVDESALADALDSGKVAGAWLDTFSEEPYRGRLCDYSKVILTPHIGSYTAECRVSMETEAVENLLKGLMDGQD
ncbi:hydroxyacid dehydrogenase [Candidatus Parcubacteria bacterium]|nr:MAG: hydroxyacid dehydrogenase [Candidatus Parcubacteria bacterium]